MTTDAPTLLAFFSDVLVPHRFSDLTPPSRHTYKMWLRIFNVYLGRPALLSDLTTENFAGYQAWLPSRPYTAGVCARARRCLRTVWAEAHAMGKVAEAPPPKLPQRRRRVLPRLVRQSPKKPHANWALPAAREFQPLVEIGPAMLVKDFVAVHVLDRNLDRPIGRELSSRTASHYEQSAARLSRCLGRPATLGDLKAETLNGFLGWLSALGNSPYTLATHRRSLLALWRQGHRRGIIGPVTANVRRVHCPPLEVEGYTLDQVQLLLATAATMSGLVRGTGIPRQLYWGSCLRTMWDLGLRAGDMMAIEVRHFDPIGRLWVLEHKTRKSRWHALRPSTSQAILACVHAEPARDLIWPALRPPSFCRAFARLATDAGLPGTSRWMRSGSSSAVERERPGQGWRFLNHSTPSVFEKHYRVESVCQPDPILPPELIESVQAVNAIGGGE